MSCQTSYTYLFGGLYMSEKTGIIKELDNLGRLVIPKEFRERFGLNKAIELVVTSEGILLKSPEYKLVKAQDEESS